MNQPEHARGSRLPLYAVLVIVLLACLWIGWSDVDLAMSQDEIRESIRSTIRRLLQIGIQFVIPAAILLFFVKEALRWLRSRGSSP
ncbi:MAG: hypothetical protein AAGH76_10195 [Pseudomonadota bacterium]